MADHDRITLPGGKSAVEIEEGYAVEADGGVWTRWWKGTTRSTGPRDQWKRMNPVRQTTGYMAVYFAGSRPPARKQYVHRLVAAAYIGAIPPGYQACHKNGVRHDNRVENIRIDTRKGNAADKFLHGTQPIGETHHYAIHSNELVLRVASMIRDGMTTKAITEATGMVKQSVNQIKRGGCWSHLTGIKRRERTGTPKA